jgi:hypothetical protein
VFGEENRGLHGGVCGGRDGRVKEAGRGEIEWMLLSSTA